MKINFYKMQSLGNDFVIIDISRIIDRKIFTPTFIRNISNRHYGVGCDLVALYAIQSNERQYMDNERPLTVNVHFFNPDGNEVEICGNAIKCIGLLLKKVKNIPKCILKTKYSLESTLYCDVDDVISFSMPKPSYDYSKIGISSAIKNPKNIEVITLLDNTLIKALGIYHTSAVCVGNPHLILFMHNLPSLNQICTIGASLSTNHLFKNNINVNFGQIISDSEIKLFVFERGAGMTLACGSGAYATAYTAFKNKFIKCDYNESCIIHQRGGSLKIQFLPDDSAIQSGNASLVFSGNIEVENSEDSNTSFHNTADSTAITKIYTDGACRGNPGPGGWGAVIISNGKTKEISGYEENTTNNRMELTATINALEQTDNDCLVEVYTDSQYVKNGITVWINNWTKNNWKNSDNKPVKNQDLWKRLLNISAHRKISWHWLKGHNGNNFNERADVLAKSQIGQ